MQTTHVIDKFTLSGTFAEYGCKPLEKRWADAFRRIGLRFGFASLLICLASAALSLMPVSNASASSEKMNLASLDTGFVEAMKQYRQGKWSGAYGRFSSLADRGHIESARIALHMFRHGSQLYGNEWGATQSQLKTWMKLAQQSSAPIASLSGD